MEGRSVAKLQRGALFIGLLALLAAGCKNNDLVEAQLRARDNDLRELREELERIEGYNCALQREVGALRTDPTGEKVPPEVGGQTFTLKSIELGRLTGGLNDDNEPGDEALQVMVEPKDVDGHTIKAPGSLAITAFEVTPEGLKKPLSSWQIPASRLHRKWRSGLFSTGYYLVFPWKAYPSSEKLRIVAQLTLSDGRVFEADKDVTIRLVPEKYRKKGVPQSDPNEAPDPDGDTPLPLPRKEAPANPDLGPDFIGRTDSPPNSSLIRAVHLLKPVPAP
ncbi:MAG: hypothetical protein ACJ8FY_27905 [Gemmataceae bacterium]